jgi:hypothetical protein
MKLLLVALVAAALAYDLEGPAINQALINEINSNPQSTWTAGVNEYFVGRKLKDVKYLMGLRVDSDVDSAPRVNKHKIEDLPAEFDAAKNWPKCKTINHVRDQGECGSCWAISSAEVMSDRWCIGTDGKEDPMISAQDITSCFNSLGCQGCNGGNPKMVFMLYWPYYGAVTGGDYHTKDTCYPYEMPECEHHTKGPKPACNGTKETPKCPNKCTVPSFDYQKEKAKYKGKDSGSISGEEAIMNEIYENGPVVCGMHIYEDFLNYKSGVYKHTGGGKELGGHALKIVGWGVDAKSKAKYWKVVNSWNEDWGDHGIVRVSKGNDECGIETWLIAAGKKA